MQPYQQAILQALSIPRYISQTDDTSAKTVEYPQVPAQLLSDLSIAINQPLTEEQVVFGEQLIVTSAHITLPYPFSGSNLDTSRDKIKSSIYAELCVHFLK